MLLIPANASELYSVSIRCVVSSSFKISTRVPPRQTAISCCLWVPENPPITAWVIEVGG
jgi:hypothetical protein